MQLLWITFFFTLLTQCNYGNFIRLERKISLPYSYYIPQENFVKPKVGFGKTTHDQEFVDVSEYYLYTNNLALEKNAKIIQAGKLQQANQMLLEQIVTIKYIKDKTILGRLHNNLALTFLLLGNIKKAKEHINQAGIYLHGNLQIIKNNRIISSFLQKFKTIK